MGLRRKNYKAMKTITISLLFLTVSIGNCQDVITLKNRDEIQAKITEISKHEIRYKKWENLEGAVYVMDKEFVFMIKYQNGTKDVFANQEKTEKAEEKKTQQQTLQEAENKPEPKSVVILDNDMYQQGVKDARKYYKVKPLVLWGTWGSTMLVPPVRYCWFNHSGVYPT